MAWDNSTRSSTLPRDWHKRRTQVLDRDRHKCKIMFDEHCLIKANEVDHIIDPHDHRMSNLQAACTPCNAHKNIATRPKRRQNTRAREPHPSETMID